MPEKAALIIDKHIGQDFQPTVIQLPFGERSLTYQTFSYTTYTLDGTPVSISEISGYKDESGFPFFTDEVFEEMEKAIEAAGGNRTVFLYSS